MARLILLVIAGHAPLSAQGVAENSADLSDVELSVEQIRAARSEAVENPELDQEIRARVVELYDAAEKSLAAVSSFSAQADRFEQEASVSPARIQALQQELDQPVESERSLPEDATTAQMEELLSQARAELAAATQALLDEDQLSTQRALGGEKSRPGWGR